MIEEKIFFSRPDNAQTDACFAIDDPVSYRLCRCSHCLPLNTSLSLFSPFHHRPRTLSPTISESSIRNNTESSKTENSSESTENQDNLIKSNLSSVVTSDIQPTANEKPADWIASTPNSVDVTGRSSILGSIAHVNSIAANSPIPNPTPPSGVKRPAAKAFVETGVEDDESEQHKQTYDFHRTDSL